MNSIKQQLIELLEHSIEQAEAKIEELNKPSQKSAVQMRSAEREFWRKKIKKIQERVKGVGRMNKQELIEKIEAIPDNIGLVRPHIDKKVVLGLIRQLDEPQKVKVPQFVADVIEGAREQSAELEDAFEYVWEVAIGELQEWFRKLENRDNFARAWLDGYEVEKEPKYTVRVKGVNEECEYLFFGELSNTWKFRSLGSFGKLKKHHTRKQLEEAGFGWVFDCEGIEIEVVE